jgi:hypothetical protein
VEKLAPWYESEKFPKEVSASDVAAATQLGEQIDEDTGYIVECYRYNVALDPGMHAPAD